MSTLDEALSAPTPMGSDLWAGVDAISLNQTVTFTRYVRVVLPVDGFVFWVRADLVSLGAQYNAAIYNTTQLDQPPAITTPAATIVAKGSLHYATELRQEEQNSFSVNRVVFTSEREINDLNAVGPTSIYVGTFQGVTFAFSNRASFYQQADLWHYVGAALYSDMQTQLVDNAAVFNRAQVVSNSLPFWLALNGYAPFYGFGNLIPLFPSFAVPPNQAPPFGAVHVEPGATRAFGGFPTLDRLSNHKQLATDRVRVTLTGVRNDGAADFLDCVIQRSTDYNEFGLLNVPAIRDEKRAQVEFNTLAQRKTIDFDVSYYQARANNIARQLILSAVPTYNPTDLQAA